jgi:signal transduction histidine kinase
VGSRGDGPLLSEWQRRLDSQLRANVMGDLIAQLCIVPVFFIYPSVWVLVLWMIRWVVLGTIAWARALLPSPDPSRPVLTVLFGHLAGALAVTLIVPEFASISVLIVIGDLQLWSDFLARSSHMHYQRIAAVSAGMLGLLSLQQWTSVGRDAPQWLLLVFLVGQGIGITLLIARQTWETMNRAKAQGQQLAISRMRLQMAEDETRRALADSVSAGPRERLQGLRGRLDGPWDGQSPEQDRVLATRGLEVVQDVISALRAIGHGIAPAGVSLEDLGLALQSVDWGAGPAPRIDCDLDPAPPPSVAETLLEISVEVCSWARRCGSRLRSVAVRWHGDRVAFAIDTAVPSDRDAGAIEPRLNDLVGAAGGDIDVLGTDDGTRVVGSLPSQILPASPSSASAAAPRDVAALESYLDYGLVMTCGGLLTIAVVSFVKQYDQLLGLGLVVFVVAVLQAVARQELRRGMVLQAIVLTTIETAIAALVMIPLPILAPVLAASTVVPLLVAPSFVTYGQFLALMAAQQLTLVFVLSAQVFHTTSSLSKSLPPWMITVLLFSLPILISGLLIRLYRDTMDGINANNRQLQASRREVVTRSRERRHELERDLHDGAQQVVVALAVRLRVFLRQLERDIAAARAMRPALVDSTNEAIASLTAFSDGSYPTDLASGGLAAALDRLARRCPCTTTVDVEVGRDLPAGVELAVYYCCSEALQNVAKHAGPSASARIAVHDRGGEVEFEVSDTGQGFAERAPSGIGLTNMEARVQRLLGHLEVESAAERGCTVRGWLPLEKWAAARL